MQEYLHAIVQKVPLFFEVSTSCCQPLENCCYRAKNVWIICTFIALSSLRIGSVRILPLNAIACVNCWSHTSLDGTTIANIHFKMNGGALKQNNDVTNDVLSFFELIVDSVKNIPLAPRS